MNLVEVIFFVTGAYLLGSIPFGLLIGFKAKGIDVRQYGSKNIGATNVFRVVGKKWGILVFVLDAIKGYVACKLPVWFLRTDLSVSFLLLLGITAILAHTFPVWLKFKGGKGVATSLGVFLAVAWIPTLLTFLLWILVFVIFHIISVASLAAAFIFPWMIAGFYWGTAEIKWLLPISLVLALFIFYTHKANIQRLVQGTEKKLF